jgi:hypothetical protein
VSIETYKYFPKLIAVHGIRFDFLFFIQQPGLGNFFSIHKQKFFSSCFNFKFADIFEFAIDQKIFSLERLPARMV